MPSKPHTITQSMLELGVKEQGHEMLKVEKKILSVGRALRQLGACFRKR